MWALFTSFAVDAARRSRPESRVERREFPEEDGPHSQHVANHTKRCASVSLANPILIFGVTTAARTETVQVHERTWARSPAASVVWYSDVRQIDGVRCLHHTPADDDWLRRRMKVVLHVHKWYLGHFKWYMSVEDDVYVFVHQLNAELFKHDASANLLIGRVHGWMNNIPFVNGGSGVVYSAFALEQLAAAIKDGRCPQSFYERLDPGHATHLKPSMVDLVLSRCSSFLDARLVSLCGFNNQLPWDRGIDDRGLACNWQATATEHCAPITFNLVKTPDIANRLHAAVSKPCLLDT